MSTRTAKTRANAGGNNGGAIMNGGNIAVNSAITATNITADGDNLVSKTNNVGVFGSTPVVNSVKNPASPVNKANVFLDVAQLNDITETLNTLYQDPRPDLTKSIHKTETSRTLQYTTAFRNGYYNMFTGKFFVDPTVQVDTFAADHAASPTREVPGELAFMYGAKNPTNTADGTDVDYGRKTG